MLGFLKKLAIGIGKVFLAIFLIFAIFTGYGFYAEHTAKKKASAMCSSIKPGQNPAPLLARAIADGASDFQTRWRNVDGVDTLYITYVGLPPFSRHMCLVQAKSGRVISVRQSYLD